MHRFRVLLSILYTALAGLSFAASLPAFAAASDAPPDKPMTGPAGHGPGMYHHAMHDGHPMMEPMMGGMPMSPFMHALHRLNLTADQQKKVRELVDAQRDKNMAKRQEFMAKMEILANPGDPKYAATLSEVKSDVAEGIQSGSDLDMKVYGLLTAEQKAQLPKEIEEMKKQMQERRTHMQERRMKRAPTKEESTEDGKK